MLKETGLLLKEFLEMDLMKSSKLVVGEESLDNVITNVNVMVDPDIVDWVDEGEFLLTTGYFFKITDVEGQMKLIRSIKEKKLSGIGIKVSPYLEELDERVIELARELELPVIELDYNVAFTDIMTPIFRHIFEKQTSIIKTVENIHNDTMNVVLKGGGIKEIIEVLERSLYNPVMVIDYQFDDIIYNVNSKYPYQTFGEGIRKYMKGLSSKKATVKKHVDEFTIENRNVKRVFIPIIAKNNVMGYIVLFGYNKDISDFDIVNGESAANTIALDFLKKLSVQDVENKYKAEFFEDLISLDEKRKEKAINKAGYYKFTREGNYNVISIRLLGSEDDDSEDFNQFISKARYLIDLSCVKSQKNYLISEIGKTINIIFQWTNKDLITKAYMDIVDTIENIFIKKMNFENYRLGIGRIYDNIDNVSSSLADAQKAIDASMTYIDKKVVDFETLGIYKIFCQDNLKEELVKFYQATIMPLVEYDRKRDTELVKSLEIYFNVNGNLKKMSEELFTHYNTVLYRINRIQEITKLSLNDEHDRFNLHTALKIMKILSL
ncbi:MAG: PucR family transcriptional regulator ligand-binding domain-containing protein [Firmicutes bacterium]|nr:PucR family transcriptional regulator ligand-binding domain-containing protein [Bacillota bacterium]